MTGELRIGNDENLVDFVDRHQIVQHMLHHRLAGNRQQRLRLIQR
jgi:hypothetical protein